MKLLLIVLILLAQNIYAGPKTHTYKINTRGFRTRTVRGTCSNPREFKKPYKGKTIEETCSNPREFKKPKNRPVKTIEDEFTDVLKPKSQFTRTK